MTPAEHYANRVTGHDAYVTRDLTRTAGCHAGCSCGWIGPYRVSRELARADAYRHSLRASSEASR